MNATGSMISILAYLGVLLSLVPAVSSFTCTTVTQPAGQYTNLFLPCTFTFFQASSAAMDTNDYTCTLLSSSEQYEEKTVREQSVFLWPDQCVGTERRCYDYERDFDMLNPVTLDMNIPEGTTHIMLDCLADADQAQQLQDDISEGLNGVVDALMVFAVTVLICVLFIIGLSIYCCCKGSQNNRTHHLSTNEPIRTYELVGIGEYEGGLAPMAVAKVIT